MIVLTLSALIFILMVAMVGFAAWHDFGRDWFNSRVRRFWLPKHGLMDSVYMKDGGEPPERSCWKAIRCDHLHCVQYVRIDHRAGPGCFADNYEGVVCRDCGIVISESRTL